MMHRWSHKLLRRALGGFPALQQQQQQQQLGTATGPGLQGTFRDSADGSRGTSTRVERDTMGEVHVRSDRLWGAQTQRSLQNFKIGDPDTERMPEELIRALGSVKRAAAMANKAAGLLDPNVADAIAAAAAEVASGALSTHFPLIIWQTGSGTQSNMNANEVIARRAAQLLATDGPSGSTPSPPIHPNDHVNMGQSSNDTLPTAMHVSAALALTTRLLPALRQLQAALEAKAEAFKGITKVGRTHAQDATPITLGQELGGYASQVAYAAAGIEGCLPGLLQLAQGGTAVGTGLNTWQGFDAAVASVLCADTGLPFRPAPNKFAAIAAHDALVAAHGAMNVAATVLFKIGNDIRLLASGPRCGLGELVLPANEPGSSIMPGKVNPTQVEALTMVCCQVMGNNTAVTLAGASGQFELNTYKPVIIANVLRSCRLLADTTLSFTIHAVTGLQADEARIAHLLQQTLMSVTALAPHIGYERAAAIAKHAHAARLPLRQAALDQGVSEAEFDSYVQYDRMLTPRPHPRELK